MLGDFSPGNIGPGDICPYPQYLSCWWPDLDQTLKKGSWEHIQQIKTGTTIFVQATFVLGTFVHISNISIPKLNTLDLSLVGHIVNHFQLDLYGMDTKLVFGLLN